MITGILASILRNCRSLSVRLSARLPFRRPWALHILAGQHLRHLAGDGLDLYNVVGVGEGGDQRCITPNENIEKFIQKAHKYVGIEKLDGYALHELVSAIYVDAPDKSGGKRVQYIHIKYDGLGFIPLNELVKKETA